MSTLSSIFTPASSFDTQSGKWVRWLVLVKAERTHDTVELGGLVALRTTPGILGLAGAELAKVLGRLGDYILEELERDAAEWFT